MNKKQHLSVVKDFISKNSLDNAIAYLNKFVDPEDKKSLTIFQNRLSTLKNQEINGLLSKDDFESSKNRIVNSLFDFVSKIEDQDEVSATVRIKEKNLAFEFDTETRKWKQIESHHQNEYIKPPIYKRIENRLDDTVEKSKEHFVIGLPKTGKTTLIKGLLQKKSKEKGVHSYYIPFAGNKINLRELIRSAPLINDSHDKILLGLDDFDSKNEIINNSSGHIQYLIAPSQNFEFERHLYDSNSSFVEPFDKEVIYKHILNLIDNYQVKLSPGIINRIVLYSGGIIEVAEQLVNYFYIHGKLPNPIELEQVEHFKIIRRIYNYIENFKDLNALKTWSLLLGLFSTGKNIDFLLKNLRLNDSNSSTYLKHIGVDSLVDSLFIRKSVLSIFGNKRIEDFNKNELPFLSRQVNENKIALWTPDFDLKIFDKDLSLPQMANKLLKKHSMRVDWTKTLVNDKSVDAKYVLKTGDRINIFLGNNNLIVDSRPDNEVSILNRDAELNPLLRSEKYKQRNRKQKELIHLGDTESRNGNWEKALNYYQDAISQKTDSNWCKVRLANLYRYLGRYDESIDICQKIVRSTPNPFASLCLGINYYWSGDVSLALECFDQCLKWKNNYINARVWKARCLLHFSESVYEIDELLSYIRESREKNIIEKKRKTLKKSFQEINTYGIMLCYMNYGEAYRRYQKELEKKVIQTLEKEKIFFFKNDLLVINYKSLLKIKSDIPIILYTLYLSQHDLFEEKNEKVLHTVKNVLDQFSGLKDDFRMWHQLIPWKTEYKNIDKNKLLEMILR